MNVFVKLWEDVTKLWSRYAGLYLNGVWNTISLAVICTAVGCIIGLFCGVLNTIPYSTVCQSFLLCCFDKFFK